jgi:hypothetical protein
MTHNRLLRELARANELLSASKYTAQTNTQKVNRLETGLRELHRANRSVVAHIVAPTLLKWTLALLSWVLLGVSYAFRVVRRLFFFRKQQPQSLLRVEGFVQSAQLWMEGVRSESLRPLTDPTSPMPQRRPSSAASKK